MEYCRQSWPPLTTRLRTVYEKFAMNPHDPGEWEVIIGPFIFLLDAKSSFEWTGGDEHYNGEYQDLVCNLRVRTRTVEQWQDTENVADLENSGNGYVVGVINCEIDELPPNPTMNELINELKVIFASDFFSRLLHPRYRPVCDIQVQAPATSGESGCEWISQQTLINLVELFTAGAWRYPGGLLDYEEYHPGRDRKRKFHAGLEVFTHAKYKRPVTIDSSDTIGEVGESDDGLIEQIDTQDSRLYLLVVQCVW